MKICLRCLAVCLLALGVPLRARAQEQPQPLVGVPGTQGQLGYIDLLAGLGYTSNALLSSGAPSVMPPPKLIML